MYSFPNLEPVCCSMFGSNCCFLTCIQISQEAGQVVQYSHLFQNFPQFIVIHRVNGFGIGNKAEIDVFLELSCFFHDPVDVGNLISGSSAFSKSSLNIWKFTVHVLLKPGLENFEHYFASVWDDCNCAIVWTFFGIAFLWDWNEKEIKIRAEINEIQKERYRKSLRIKSMFFEKTNKIDKLVTIWNKKKRRLKCLQSETKVRTLSSILQK